MPVHPKNKFNQKTDVEFLIFLIFAIIYGKKYNSSIPTKMIICQKLIDIFLL